MVFSRFATREKFAEKTGKRRRGPSCIIYCLYLVHNIYALIECIKPITIQGIRFVVFYVRRGVVVILCEIPMVKKFFDKSR